MAFWDALSGFVSGAKEVVAPLASVASSIISSNAADRASQAQTAAANKSGETQLQIYNQNRADSLPFMDVGENALYNLAAGAGIDYEGAPGTVEERRDTALSRFMASPDYGFRVTEGINALDRSASSRGRLRSGAQDKAITKYGQNVASGEWGNYQNRLASLAGLGQTSTANLAATGTSAGQAIGNAYQNAGAARASGYAGQANALNSGLNNLSSWSLR